MIDIVYAAPRCSVAAYLLACGFRPLPLLSLLCPSTARRLRWLLHESFQATHQGFGPQKTREARAVDHGPHAKACCHQCAQVSKSRHIRGGLAPDPRLRGAETCLLLSVASMPWEETLQCGKPAWIEGALCTAVLRQLVDMNLKDVTGPVNTHARGSLARSFCGSHTAEPPFVHRPYHV